MPELMVCCAPLFRCLCAPLVSSSAPVSNSYLTELKFHGGINLLENAVSVATVIPTPTIERNQDIVYMTATTKLVVNGTNFREKNMELVFDPPLERNKDYILSVSENCDGDGGSDLCFCWANYCRFMSHFYVGNQMV